MAEPRTLHGRFVDLRQLTVDDAELTFRWRESSRAKLLNKGAPSVAAQAEWIRKRPGNEHNFIIQLKDGRPVGMLSLVGIDPVNRHAEPGRFLIGDEQAVRGVPAAVEAMKLLYQLAFDELGLVRLFGTIASDNSRMAKWQKYLGMREEGRMRSHYFIDGKFQDALVFGILDEEYRRDALPKMQSLIAMAAAPAASADQEN
jgi:RimJ/RimL family protein N-acetyltransferase